MFSYQKTSLINGTSSVIIPKIAIFFMEVVKVLMGRVVKGYGQVHVFKRGIIITEVQTPTGIVL
jgi:hypothetical protein